MPTPYIEKVAHEHHQPVAHEEAKWTEAKQKAAEEGQPDNYVIITEIFKRMTHTE